ncbi:PLDc N-terminal domain-containing protein [Marinilabilia sp.]|uniref:PLDc N-terminal domain-containing protein n=1 Tax=Marinilabilia sp. TaxID=2021252 RepID=UPI00345C6578
MTIGLLSFAVFWIWILIKIFRAHQPLNYKTGWTIFVLFIPIVGSWVYYHLELKKLNNLQ